MGNYNGTIRCGYCYNEGHNSRTCPVKLERAQKRLESAKQEGAHVEYYARQVARMTGVNPETGAKRTRRNESWGRKCSCCKESGHNRRKCTTLASDITTYAVLTAETRAAARSMMIEQGIGIGAMVERTSYGDKSMYLVESIECRFVHPKDKCVKARLRPLNPAQRPTSMQIDEQDESTYNGYSVVAPVTVDQINQSLPGDWEEQSLDLKASELSHSPFKKGESRDYYYWRDIDAASGE